MFKTVIVLLLLVTVISLFAAMVFLVRDHGDSKRSVKALTVRITLSLLLFGLLFVGYFSGALKPHGIVPIAPPDATNAEPPSD